MKGKIITFGEMLLRYSKMEHRRLCQGTTFSGNFGGSEANVAISLATLGDDVEFVTRVPDSIIGRACCMKLREYNVNIDHVITGGERFGTYFFEEAAAMRNSQVIYDRNNSAFCTLKPGMINWREVFKDAAIFHASGITCAISKDAADATFEALQIADEMGLTISCDINYRKNLWKYGADAGEVTSRMLQYSDMIFGDACEFEVVTGAKEIPFKAMTSDYKMDMDAYAEWFDVYHRKFPRCKRVLMGTRNQIAAGHHTLTGLLYSSGKIYSTKINDITQVVDPMGVGDAFAAGFIHAYNNFAEDDQLYLDYALAAASLKNTISGDANLSTNEEIEALMHDYMGR
jgi:2-dehydro-3-deoxygluconokinase